MKCLLPKGRWCFLTAQVSAVGRGGKSSSGELASRTSKLHTGHICTSAARSVAAASN